MRGFVRASFKQESKHFFFKGVVQMELFLFLCVFSVSKLIVKVKTKSKKLNKAEITDVFLGLIKMLNIMNVKYEY